MADVVLYTKPWCSYCLRAKQLLTSKGVAFTEHDLSRHPELRQEMEQRSGRYTVPQIWIGSTQVGGCDDLYALERQGKLDALLKG